MKRLRELPNWIIVAGAVAGAVVSIAAAYRVFDPEDEPPPPVGRVSMSGLHVDPRVKLADYLATRKLASGATGPKLVSVTLVASVPAAEARSQTEPPPSPPGTEPPSPPGTEPPSPPGTEPPPPQPPEPTLDPNVNSDQAEKQDLDRQPDEVQNLLDETGGSLVGQLDLPPPPSASDETQVQRAGKEALTGDSGASDEELRQALAGTRLGPIARAEPDKRDLLVPYGDVVSLVVEPEGYARRTLVVRWTLFDVRTRRRIPRRWLTRRLAFEFTPRRNIDRVDEDFWVPRPVAFRGPFFVRIELFDDEHVRLRRRDVRIR